GSPSFRTSEHYIIYREALLFGDEGVAERILAAQTPGEAKMLGRQARRASNFELILGNYLKFKFSQNPKLKEILLNTSDTVIAEASPVDRIWGIGFDAEHAKGNEADWGANKLGGALMGVRVKLRS
ncbi:hypothetical protein BDZ45DRAFT_585217, partial [Acephala macrosclerotiorum]